MSDMGLRRPKSITIEMPFYFLLFCIEVLSYKHRPFPKFGDIKRQIITGTLLLLKYVTVIS